MLTTFRAGKSWGRVAVLAVVWSPLLSAAEPNGPVDFAREILPVLSDKCFVCHGPAGEAREALRLDSFAAATESHEGRQAIAPKVPGKSQILVRIHSAEEPMPPADAEKQLTAAERELLDRWVRQGGTYATHWSFVPPKKTEPDVRREGQHIIDDFIASGFGRRGGDFSREADRRTLARRASLVLTGLPPDPGPLSEFLSDRRPGAYGRFVDRLLKHPRYGEHQARYWLDAVRYGDTHGLHLDNRRAIFPFRDWVVMALNRNLRLDKFITWQLAGDLLKDPTLEQLVATGFVRMNPSTAEGGAIPAEFQAKNNFDRVETLGTVFLGMSLTCARCHTHKYDPIPQREYYRLLAFFNSTAEASMDGNKYEYGPVIRAPGSLMAWRTWDNLHVLRKDLLARSAKNLKSLESASPEYRKDWTAAKPADQLVRVADPKGPFAKLKLHKQATELVKRVAEVQKGFTSTLVARDLPKPRITKVLERGEYNRPQGDVLKPGILTVMGAFPEGAPRNRLGLARWLTSRTHPLTARVLVNRIWQRTFGYGLVRTPEDFGLQGQQPTHPQLLDWLAVELHDSGWDLKHMLRMMVTSRTFRQSSAWREGMEDPENRLFARGPSHRLDAEVIRDMGLWASGLMVSQAGGEGAKPYQPGGLWSALMHPASNTKLYVADKGARLYHRSLYVYWKRTSPHPMMTLFDAPSRESSCVRRSRTNTSLQSLGLLNETQRMEMARVLAGRLLREAKDDDGRLDMLFGLLASRDPNPRERAACRKLLEVMTARFAKSPKDAQALLSTGASAPDARLNATAHAAWAQVAVTVLASDVAILLY